jgi:hypothetical protein
VFCHTIITTLDAVGLPFSGFTTAHTKKTYYEYKKKRFGCSLKLPDIFLVPSLCNFKLLSIPCDHVHQPKEQIAFSTLHKKIAIKIASKKERAIGNNFASSEEESMASVIIYDTPLSCAGFLPYNDFFC